MFHVDLFKNPMNFRQKLITISKASLQALVVENIYVVPSLSKMSPKRIPRITRSPMTTQDNLAAYHLPWRDAVV
jgi:hypothetical protein